MLNEWAILVFSFGLAGIITLVLYIQSKKHYDSHSKNELDQQSETQDEQLGKTSSSHNARLWNESPSLSDCESRESDRRIQPRKGRR